MKLYTMSQAPNPRRVALFLQAKNVAAPETVEINIMAAEHKSEGFRAISPFAQLPALALDDGRVLTESRAICRYFEGLYPDPNLMGRDAEETAFIEMWDRTMELKLFFPAAMWVRHGHPGFAVLEKQNAETAQRGEAGFKRVLDWLETELAQRDFVAGDRFTIADITALVGVDFTRIHGFKLKAETHPLLYAWRERVKPTAA
ncbi:MAG: glutathione S-transferase family protein [Maricaulaceae bacterium]